MDSIRESQTSKIAAREPDQDKTELRIDDGTGGGTQTGWHRAHIRCPGCEDFFERVGPWSPYEANRVADPRRGFHHAAWGCRDCRHEPLRVFKTIGPPRTTVAPPARLLGIDHKLPRSIVPSTIYCDRCQEPMQQRGEWIPTSGLDDTRSTSELACPQCKTTFEIVWYHRAGSPRLGATLVDSSKESARYASRVTA